ncbi:Small-conductance mechanosensitive channel [Abditibacterium utsteinense]|uniref:Small-conductance mechanosensitive channel n=1 Tax=Abditibacterium utsteinense TaxID=1960156 RepID=A0A2S8SQQ8_9BACT|nr:mechanosensitive ion channel family protein [Abditibacterium utsteinense]PQV63116.1 Small-conductance mechanosensitive channel [Abditibacterium utsteinense]
MPAPLRAQVAAPAPLKLPTPTAAPSEIAPVGVEGRRLFDVGPSGNSSALQRATRINRRLQNLIEGEVDLPRFSPDAVKAVGGEQVITLGNVSVITITQSDAEDAGQTSRDLALVQGTVMSRAVRDARASRQNPLRGAGILISNSLRGLISSFLGWLPRVFAAALLILIFYFLARLARAIARASTARLGFDPNLRALLLALSFYGVWLVGTLAILSALGLDSSSLAAAVGVSGFVLGFAFKDILSHFLAGILLLISGKFRIGDQIVVREFEGTVERIELRALELRTYDNRLVIIPNGDVFSAAVTSNTASPHRRRSFVVPIPHQYDIEGALRLMEEAVKNTPGVLETPAPDVIIEDITQDSVILRARFSTNSMRTDYVRVGSECMKNVKLAFTRALASLQEDAQEPEIQAERL